MVTRPSASDLVPPPLSHATNRPPYPTSPISDRKNRRNELDDREDSGSDWDKDSDDEGPEPIGPVSGAPKSNSSTAPGQVLPQDALPETLRVGTVQANSQGFSEPLEPHTGFPEALRVGSNTPLHSRHGSASIEQSPPQISTHSTGSSGRKLSIKNPYLRKQFTGANDELINNSQSAWGTPAAPSHPPPPPPINVQPASPPTDQLENMSLLDQANPPEEQIDGFPEMRETPVEGQPVLPGTQLQHQDTGFSSIARGNPWASELTAEQKWCDVSTTPERREIEPKTQHEQLQGEDRETAPDLPPRSTSYNEASSPKPPRSTSVEDVPPPQPPRLGKDVADASAESSEQAETPMAKAKRQRSEHYSIKHINWFDERSSSNPRKSPIIIQNANGPCPLLALVNALVLSTPPDFKTDLIETLRVREQISLGLLLDAVLEELMSGRRGDAAHELPDVGDLYAFLITLHTGMNVNPRFVSNSSDMLTEKDKPAGPGTFEETREMQLYGTFAVPLLHGWLPPADSPALAALRRSAQTYEDAQNIQFREEELEDKLQASALTSEEQQIFEDVISIKEFLQTWPTQLTDCGLQLIRQIVRPGEMAILFRNDHFSTLYKEPRKNRLMTLVTDAGYASHAEIIWESLADVSGRRSELFSGDFRPVGNVQDSARARGSSSEADQSIRSLVDDDDDGWETVPARYGKSSSSTNNAAGVPSAHVAGITASGSNNNDGPTAATSNTEQEDHDFALALQLEEQWNDADRHSQVGRRRGDDRSRRHLARESPALSIPGRSARPEVPPRRNGRGASNNAPKTHRPHADGEDAPPPYEQAASDPPYIPGQSPPNPTLPERPRRPSAYGQQAAANSMGQSTYQQFNHVASGQGYGRGQSGRGATSPMSARRRGTIPPGAGRGGPPMGRGAARRQSGGGQYIPPTSDDRDKCVLM